MSNHLAIATVTAVLRRTLQDALDAAQPSVIGARVTTLRPDAPPAELPDPGVNIFLYRSAPGDALRSADPPRRRGEAAPGPRPHAAVELHYLFTFHGADARLEPQVMHGIVTRALHERPAITRAAIESTLTDPAFSFLSRSDLADAVDLARVRPVGLSIEDMTRLWSVFHRIPYPLSVAYCASLVFIGGDVQAPCAPPVRTPRVRMQASSSPSVDRVVSAAAPGDAQAWILPGQDVLLLGRRMQSTVTRVRFGDVEVIPDPDATTDDQIRVTLPASLVAGVHGVQVVHRRTTEPASSQAASNIAPFVLHPTITAQRIGSNLRVNFAPPVGRRQHVAVLLDEVPTSTGRNSRSYMFRAPARPSTDPDTAASLDVPFAGVAPGDYLVRVQVDGAESPLTFDPALGIHNAPKLTI